jgi:hypothetical protein
LTREDAIQYAQQSANHSGRIYYAVKMYDHLNGWSFGIYKLRSYKETVEAKPEVSIHV